MKREKEKKRRKIEKIMKDKQRESENMKKQKQKERARDRKSNKVTENCEDIVRPETIAKRRFEKLLSGISSRRK